MPIDSFSTLTLSATTILMVEVIFTVTGGTPNVYTARYNFDQISSDGSIMQTRAGNLIPYLTPQQRSTASTFMDAMLAKARGSI